MALAAALLCAASAALLMGASSASAYVRIDSRCILRAFLPYTTGTPGTSGYTVSGAVDCTGYGNVWSEIQVCSQVANGSQWFTVSGSCYPPSGQGGDTLAYTNYNGLAVQEGGVCNHVYRTWDWGEVFYPTASNTYTSSGFIDCSIPASPAGVSGSQRATIQNAAQSPPADVQAAFAAFHRPQAGTDAMPANVTAALAEPEQECGVNPSLSRLVLNASSEKMWLVAGTQELCAVTSLTGIGPNGSTIQTSCAPNSIAARQGMLSITGSSMVAALPTGASAVTATLRNGSSVQLVPNANGVATGTVRQPPSTVAYTGSDGTQYNLTVPLDLH